MKRSRITLLLAAPFHLGAAIGCRAELRLKTVGSIGMFAFPGISLSNV
jgi:hypothetical protein